MDLAWSIDYPVQTGRARIVPFKWLIPLTGLRATESGVDRRVFGTITVVSTLMSIALGLDVAISGFRSARFTCIVVASQLSLLAQKRFMSAIRADMDFGFSWPRCLASHSSRTLCLKAAKASASGQSTIWFFLVRNLV